MTAKVIHPSMFEPPTYPRPHKPPQVLHQTYMRKLKKQTNEDFSLVHLTRKYFSETSLHGLKYLTESKRQRIERLFWFLAISVSWGGAGYMIYSVLTKWSETPILVSFDSTSTAIWNIPFPALTICNMNKIMKSKVSKVEKLLRDDPSNETLRIERRFVDEICGKHSSSHEVIDPSWDHGDMEMTGDQLHHYLNDLGMTCDQMVLRCNFEGNVRDCMEIFTPTITDEGQCCSFNIMPEPLMFRTQVVKIKPDHEEEAKWKNWDMENGYHDKPENAPNLPHNSSEDMPRRALAPGLHMGLSVMIDVKEDEYYCSGTESVGFKALLHTPNTLPELVEYGFAIEPGKEMFFSVDPEMIYATKNIYDISHKKRQCYLSHEKTLAYYQHYGFLNCFMECASNFTTDFCGCVAYYMPRDPTKTPICSPEHNPCVEQALKLVEEKAYDAGEDSSMLCNCLPPCTDMEFPHETSASNLRTDLLHFPENLTVDRPEYLNNSYVESNLALVHIFFSKRHFLRHERGELYGLVDLFANVGGLLGLCAGFSVLSCVEGCYFYTMRYFFNIRDGRKEKVRE